MHLLPCHGLSNGISNLPPIRPPCSRPPEGRITHRLLLTYKLNLAEGGKVTPTLPMLNR